MRLLVLPKLELIWRAASLALKAALQYRKVSHGTFKGLVSGRMQVRCTKGSLNSVSPTSCSTLSAFPPHRAQTVRWPLWYLGSPSERPSIAPKIVFKSNHNGQFHDAVEWQRFREQIPWISLYRDFHPIQPTFIPRSLQPKMSRVHVLRHTQSLPCCVIHHTLHAMCHGRDLSDFSETSSKSERFLAPQHAARCPMTRATLSSINISKPHHYGQAFLRSMSGCLSICRPVAIGVYSDVTCSCNQPSMQRIACHCHVVQLDTESPTQCGIPNAESG